MTPTQPVTFSAPDQAILDGLLADAQGVADAIAEVLGGGHVSMTVGIHGLPGALYHALPHEPIVSRERPEHQWKQVAAIGYSSRIDVHHHSADKPPCESCRQQAIVAEIKQQGVDVPLVTDPVTGQQVAQLSKIPCEDARCSHPHVTLRTGPALANYHGEAGA